MKYVKMLGLAAMAMAALMAFAGTAAATTVTSPENVTSTPTIEAESEGATKLSSGFFATVTCHNSSVKGKVEQHGAGVTAKGNISSLTFTNCTGGTVTAVTQPGNLEVHPTATTGNGTLTSNSAKVIVHTSVGECVFTTSATDIGTLTGSNITGGKATLDIGSSAIPQTGSNPFCPSSATWSGNYVVNAPTYLAVH
ncbi:MAG TPA: hypothetical protein VFT79_08265 [Solirubrobacterales bacterium]|nr:hypothetical protein [Solirubrobacterales bacterium]